ncbi:hypothetical protein D3C87_145660 [compost metagenome]
MGGRMKYLFIVLSLIASNSFAMQLNCSKKVSDIRTESTNVRSWPHLYITSGFTECSDSNGVGSCHTGILESIANEVSVCFKNLDVRADCNIKESGDFSSGLALDVECNNGTSLFFIMEPSKLGKVTCVENGIPKKTWDVGSCKEE